MVNEQALATHQPCEDCGSSDALAVYSDHTYCFSCNKRTATDGAPEGIEVDWEQKKAPMIMKGEIRDITDRRISRKVCAKYGVRVEYNSRGEQDVHYYPYYNTKTGDLTALKRRFCETKAFPWSGDRTDTGLFGQQTCRGKGKYITITEGEIDCLAVSEMFDGKWDVVSLKDGAGSAERNIKDNLDFLEGYDHIVLCFDNDDAGREAVEAVKDLFSPRKLKVVSLPVDFKDAGAMLVAGQVTQFVRSWWDAETYQPDGIVNIEDTWDAVLTYRDTPSTSYPWKGLQDLLLGQRTQEIVVWAADTGIGKSQTMREIQNHLIEVTDDNVGCLMLEESVAKTTLGWMSFAAGRPLHKELATIPDEELRRYWEQASSGGRLILLDHQGWQNNMETLKARIRYMKHAMDCRWVVLDHLHIALSSVQGATGDWSGIDELMTDLRSLVHELDIGLHLVCHTSGDRVLRGSKGISKIADAVVFLERDKHAENEELKNTTKVVVDKNRFAGDIGTACYLFYDKFTGRMTEVDEPAAFDDDGEF